MISRDHDAYQSAISWLVNRIDYEKLASSGSRYRFTLDRMRDLMERLGHGQHLVQLSDSAGDPPATDQSLTAPPTSPESNSAGSASTPPINPINDSVRIIHLAGTKGKGSAATMVAALLRAAGYRVGLYTSPHLVHLEERFRVDGQMATPAEMVALIDSMRPIVQAMTDAPIGGPSFFELTTAMAIEHFHRHHCDVWVLETGLGGRLDSTNVFQSHATAITTIGLDHQHVLGNTPELIAAEKAGILKPHTPAINGVPHGTVRDVIVQIAKNVDVPIRHLGDDIQILAKSNEVTDAGTSTCIAQPTWGSQFRIRGLGEWMPEQTDIQLKLEGKHQVHNAAIALALVDSIPSIREKLRPEDRIHECLASLQMQARLERFDLPGNRVLLLDTAHNADSIDAMLNVLHDRMQGRKLHCLFGTSADKNVPAMLERMQPHFDRWILTRYEGNPRYVPVDQLQTFALESGLSADAIRVIERPLQACATAIDGLSSDEVLVICGSFFLAAELRPWLVEQADQWAESVSLDLPSS
ncbi:bifunctional folylpolyglutamate synthase/dihydrofolate synthase [Rhodopirellula halodulae]|uniref:bifunctional folylpolyglutamate synthase/dihydrofolate synthase n=1 Tax=Rhodopirellula halodulae TaxID=2894198 RepID=UPI001E4DA061|nr:cyanophycin synthetase [Rhodopirellula sp. JC737]MCC9657940.1 bifunctional folylpolyglutamate synthase/dihydrofolate synthase [Rhodopirellula sp. JC737]